MPACALHNFATYVFQGAPTQCLTRTQTLLKKGHVTHTHTRNTHNTRATTRQIRTLPSVGRA